MVFGPDQSPWSVFPGIFPADFVGAIMTGDSVSEVVRVANVELTLWILQDVNRKH
jgi:hypothetical protein